MLFSLRRFRESAGKFLFSNDPGVVWKSYLLPLRDWVKSVHLYFYYYAINGRKMQGKIVCYKINLQGIT